MPMLFCWSLYVHIKLKKEKLGSYARILVGVTVDFISTFFTTGQGLP